MMKTLDLASIHQALKESEKAILNRLQAVDDAAPGLLSSQDEPALDLLYNRWVQDRFTDSKAQEQLERIRAALVRLDQGKYGKCTKCRKEINPDRLNSLPYAELCMNCQRKQEESLA